MKLNKICELEDWQELHIAPFSLHRKNWEYEQLMYGLRTVGAIRPEGCVLAVGGGHEPPYFNLLITCAGCSARTYMRPVSSRWKQTARCCAIQTDSPRARTTGAD